MSTPDSINESEDETADPADEDSGRDQSQVDPEDYPKDDGGRPDYGSPHRNDNGQEPK